jgi:hypothetical protein
MAAGSRAWIGTWATNPAGLPAVAKPGTFTLPVNFCPGNMPVSNQVAIEKADATHAEHLADAKCTYLTRPVVSAISVLSRGRHNVVVALGDSITDGTLNPATGDRGWPGLLSRRLQVSGVSVVNAGIAGNRLLDSIPM